MITKTEKNQEGSQPVNSGTDGYYSDSYGSSGTSGSANSASYDTGEEAYGDFDTLDQGDGSDQPQALDSQSLYKEISDLTAQAKSQGAGADLLKQLEEKKNLLMQSAALSPDKRNEALSGISADLENLQATMSTELEQAPARDALKKELQELRGELNSEKLDDATKKALVKECSDAEQALNNQDLDNAGSLYDQAKGDFESAKATAQEEAAQNKSDREDSAKQLKSEIKDSNLPDDKKNALLQQVEDLESSWEGQDPDPEQVQDALKAIEKDFKREKKVESLKEAFVGFASKIQRTGDEDTDKVIQDLADKFKAALDSGDWGPVLSMLKDKNIDQNALLAGIDQIIGTIYYDMAGKDEKVFEQFLDLIPTDVRQGMAGALNASPDAQKSCDYSDEGMEMYKIYGRTYATEASRLEESTQKDDITGDDGDYSPPPSSSGSSSENKTGDSSSDSK